MMYVMYVNVSQYVCVCMYVCDVCVCDVCVCVQLVCVQLVCVQLVLVCVRRLASPACLPVYLCSSLAINSATCSGCNSLCTLGCITKRNFLEASFRSYSEAMRVCRENSPVGEGEVREQRERERERKGKSRSSKERTDDRKRENRWQGQADNDAPCPDTIFRMLLEAEEKPRLNLLQDTGNKRHCRGHRT